MKPTFRERLAATSTERPDGTVDFNVWRLKRAVARMDARPIPDGDGPMAPARAVASASMDDPHVRALVERVRCESSRELASFSGRRP